MQRQLLKNQHHTAAHEGEGGVRVQHNQYREVHGRIEKPEDRHDKVAQVDGEMAAQANKLVDGCANHLLILAQSAEIVAGSKDILIEVHADNQSKDSHESKQMRGSCHEVSIPRLTEIRKQARHKYLLLDQERIEDGQQKDVDGKTVRLNEIKRQARCVSKNALLLQRLNEECEDESLQEKLIRLTQMKHQARLKGKSTLKERTEEHMDGHEDCNKFEETANSERQKEFNCLKGRMRLTHLRREVRLGCVGQGSAET